MQQEGHKSHSIDRQILWEKNARTVHPKSPPYLISNYKQGEEGASYGSCILL